MNLTHDFQNLTARIDRWAIRHHPYVIEFLRMGLGFFLIIRGLMLMLNETILETMVLNSQFEWLSFGVLQFINVLLIFGGVMVMLGFYTRPAAAILAVLMIIMILQANLTFPILDVGRVISTYLFSLVLLLFFIFYGSGYLSIDRYRIER